jgi:hypothetical protein
MVSGMLKRSTLVAVGAYIVATAVAFWFAPFIGVIMVIGLIVTAGLVALPGAMNIAIHGPGHQYRDKTSRRDY